MNIKKNLLEVKSTIPDSVTLVAVSKTKPHEAILEAYSTGHRIFGENRVQELVEKHESLPQDIEWHMIGHLQSKKVKFIAPFVALIHGVDSLKLLTEINKRALQNNRIIPCLLQMHIAKESTKFGLNQEELLELLSSENFKNLNNIEIHGLMGMATFTSDEAIVRQEFSSLKSIFDQTKNTFFPTTDSFNTLSMGMSGDYRLAITCGSTMVRVGSLIFGGR